MAKRGLALNANHDLYVDPDTRSLGIALEAGAVAQDISTRLQIIKGEYILNKNYGIDYPRLFSGQGDLVKLENALEAQIANTDGVTSLQQFRFETTGIRKLSVSFSCLTRYSEEVNIEGLDIG